MYQTNSTNSPQSAEKAKSHISFQQDLFDCDDAPHHPDFLMIDQVIEHYHQTLKLQPKLSELLIRRKIDPDTIDQYRIGFADRTLGFELQSPRCHLGSRNRGHLQRLGLLKTSGHELFRGAMVFPYPDNKGRIVGAYGRRPRRQQRSPTYHLYWNAQQVSFFNAMTQSLPRDLILCKGPLDALTLITAGFENVVATMGARGFNDQQMNWLLENGVRRVYVAFDNTPSADHYALLVAQALETIGIPCFRVRLPAGLDVNQYAMTQNDVATGFNRLLKTAVALKQHYRGLVPGLDQYWLKPVDTIEEAMAFYLQALRYAGKSLKTRNDSRIQLERFRDYCHSRDIKQLSDVTEDLLMAYQCYLVTEKNVFTGEVISADTQKARIRAVTRMLSRLYYHGVIPEPVCLKSPPGSSH